MEFAELIRNKNDINAKEGTYGFTVLMFGKQKIIDYVKIFIIKFDFIYIASIYGHNDVLQKLLENKANINEQDNKYRLTALTLGN